MCEKKIVSLQAPKKGTRAEMSAQVLLGGAESEHCTTFHSTQKSGQVAKQEGCEKRGGQGGAQEGNGVTGLIHTI